MKRRHASQLASDNGLDQKQLAAATRKADKLGFNDQVFTLILCGDRRREKCCGGKEMELAWKQIKRRCKQWKESDSGTVIRIKSACFDVCKAGPIVGVMPDGVWYGQCSPSVIDRIFDEHLQSGNLIEEHLIAGPGLDF